MSDTPDIHNNAVCTVHTPNGPTNACAEHAEQVARLFQFLGSHVTRTVLDAPATCDNCANARRNREGEG